MTDNPTRADWDRAVQALQRRLEASEGNHAPETARRIKRRLERAASLAKRGYAVAAYATLVSKDK